MAEKENLEKLEYAAQNLAQNPAQKVQNTPQNPDLEINPDFQHALERFRDGEKTLLVHGEAGTGKSTLLAHALRNQYLAPDTVLLAPTGVAALNIGGQTIHSFFGLPHTVTPETARSSNPRDADLIKNLKTVVIDEISMVRADLMDCVDLYLQKHGPVPNTPFGGVRMVFVGDLYQLPPVVQRDEKAAFLQQYETPYFFSSKVIQETGVELAELSQIYRQKDPGFRKVLGNLRTGTLNQQGLDYLNEQYDESIAETPANQVDPKDYTLNLTTTNRNADQINAAKLAALDTPERVSFAKTWGNFDKKQYPTAPRLAYKEGAQIMLLTNDKEHRWVNGSLGIVTQAEEGRRICVRLHDDNREVWVNPHKWKVYKYASKGGKISKDAVGSFEQLPVRLAWGITIHKSQGKTYDNVIIDFERGAWDPGQAYVAFSRSRTKEGYRLRTKIKWNSIHCDKKITKFLNDLRSPEQAQEKPQEKPKPESQENSHATQETEITATVAETVAEPGKTPKNLHCKAHAKAHALDEILGRGPAIRALLEHAKTVQEIGLDQGKDPQEAVIRFDLETQEIQENPSNFDLSFRVFPAELPGKILEKVNSGLAKAGLEPLSGNLNDLRNGTERRTLHLSVEAAVESSMGSSVKSSNGSASEGTQIPKTLHVPAKSVQQAIERLLKEGENPRPGRTTADPVYLGPVQGLREALRSQSQKIQSKESQSQSQSQEHPGR